MLHPSLTGIKIDLPATGNKRVLEQNKKIVLSINNKGEYFIGKQKIAQNLLSAKIQAIFLHKKQKSLYIRADKNVKYQHVVKAMSIAKLAGVSKLSMITKKIRL